MPDSGLGEIPQALSSMQKSSEQTSELVTAAVGESGAPTRKSTWDAWRSACRVHLVAKVPEASGLLDAGFDDGGDVFAGRLHHHQRNVEAADLVVLHGRSRLRWVLGVTVDLVPKVIHLI